MFKQIKKSTIKTKNTLHISKTFYMFIKIYLPIFAHSVLSLNTGLFEVMSPFLGIPTY